MIEVSSFLYITLTLDFKKASKVPVLFCNPTKLVWPDMIKDKRVCVRSKSLQQIMLSSFTGYRLPVMPYTHHRLP